MIIGRFARYIKYGIENFITWAPIIWGDRQWDYEFFYRILEKKLELMSKHFKFNYCEENADARARSPRYCDDYFCDSCSDFEACDAQRKIEYLLYKLIELLKRIQDDDYFELAEKNFESKLLKCDCLEDLNRTKTPEEKKLFHDVFILSQELKDKDEKEFYDLLRKSINTFWD